jgi:ABC-type phosphate/phosphonate transport system substrate-binding protein
VPSSSNQIAELGMYPFESVRWAWDALWEAIRERAPWVPPRLAHSGDVHARWDDPRCVVNQVCAWPLARYHADDHSVLGSFAVDVPEADGHTYRSVLLATRDVPLAELVHTGTQAAVNSIDSLSGWVSLVHATVGSRATWPGGVTLTGSHAASVQALVSGESDLASIDAWSLALLSREQPDLLAGLHRVGFGPRVPTPPITVRATIDPSDAARLTVAIVDALDDPAVRPAREALLIDAFAPTAIDEYLRVLELIKVPE